MNDEELDWAKVGEQAVVPKIPLFDVRLDLMRNPVTEQVLERVVLGAVDWVNVAALDADGRSIMVRQFRFGAGYATLETVGGMVDPGEEPLAAAQRELFEETGYVGGEWRYLGAVEPNPAIHDNLCHHFLATDVRASQRPDPEPGEVIRVECLTEQEILQSVQSGELRHALALSVLSRVFDLWPRPFSDIPTVGQAAWQRRPRSEVAST